MDGFCGGGRNSFALVAYLPEPLARFIDDLRSDLAPGCRLRAHITILPPRPLICTPESAWRELHDRLQQSPAFSVELREVRQFNESGVIYISLGAGYADLERLHGRLNSGFCEFPEAWYYHPHVTLAQSLGPGAMPVSLDLATRRWREYPGSRSFALDRVTFVQNVADGEGGDASPDQWADLESFDLHPAVAV
jgi:2'-5' RNA ligase